MTKCSYLFLGGLVIISNYPASYAKAIAGIKSVPIEIYNTITVVTGSGNWTIMKPTKGNIWATWLVRA